MKALFEYGYQLTIKGETWRDFQDMMGSVNQIELQEAQR